MDFAPHGTDGGMALFLVKQVKDQFPASGWSGCVLQQQMTVFVGSETTVEIGFVTRCVCFRLTVGSTVDEDVGECAAQTEIWVVKLIQWKGGSGRFEVLFQVWLDIDIKSSSRFFEELNRLQRGVGDASGAVAGWVPVGKTCIGKNGWLILWEGGLR